jgi:organic hydroperoxide reductase OsmC/OhrA
MADERPVNVTLDLEEGFRFRVDLDQEGVAPLVVDEPAPLGDGAGPNAVRLLAAAVGQCLSASALFCLRKARIDVQDLRTNVRVTTGRNEEGRLRVQALHVDLEPVVPVEQHPRMRRCLELFEDYCVVTQAVRGGIEVDTRVEPVAPQAEVRAA